MKLRQACTICKARVKNEPKNHGQQLCLKHYRIWQRSQLENKERKEE